MANVFIDDVEYENLIHRLEILEDVLNNLVNDKLLDNIQQFASDYESIDKFFKENKKHILDIDVLVVNGILDASRIKESDNISDIFKSVKGRMQALQNEIDLINKTFSTKKNIITQVSTNIDRLSDNIENIRQIKNNLIKKDK